METEQNFSSSDSLIKNPKTSFITAVLLGLLTFMVSGLIALIISIIFFFLGKVSEDFNLILIIGEIFGLQDLGGFFVAQFIIIGIFASLGDLGTALISWFINRSKKLALITFVSALVFQIIVIAFVLPLAFKKAQDVMDASIEREKAYLEYATIGDVSSELVEPFSVNWGIDGKLVELSLFKKLILVIPISVSKAGTYRLTARYYDSEIGAIPMKEVTQNFNVGSNVVRIEFLSDDSKYYGYKPPESTNGMAEIGLEYLDSGMNSFVSRKEIKF